MKSQPQPDKVTVDTDQVEGMAEQVEKERLELLLQELQNKVDEKPAAAEVQGPDPVRDHPGRLAHPDHGRRKPADVRLRQLARLKPYFEDILLAMADTIKAVPNKISISGHTDAKPYAGTGDFGNWELSANRANAARRALVAGSYPESQVARVVGYASSALFDRENPLNPVNRRIDIVVLTKKAQRPSKVRKVPSLLRRRRKGRAVRAKYRPRRSIRTHLPADQQPVPAHELRERLNLFDDAAPKPAAPGTAAPAPTAPPAAAPAPAPKQ